MSTFEVSMSAAHWNYEELAPKGIDCRNRASSTAAESVRNRAIDETRPGHHIEERWISVLVLDVCLAMATMPMVTTMNSTAPTLIAIIGSNGDLARATAEPSRPQHHG